jgi:U6 snRNA-associated Sm-like protein LSm1
MENLSLHERPSSGGNHEAAAQNLGMPPPPQQPQQLPPQMFTTAAQLLDLTDSECAGPRGCIEESRGCDNEGRKEGLTAGRETYGGAERWAEIDRCAEELGSVR